jgi:PAS domain-containing protein
MMRDATSPDWGSRPQPQPKDILTVLSHDSRDGVWTVDADGSLLFINPVAEYLLGWKTDDLQDRPFHDVVHGAHGDACPLQDVLRFGHPDSQHLFNESVQTIQAQGHWQGRAVNVRKDGMLLHLDASGTAFVYRGAGLRLQAG